MPETAFEITDQAYPEGWPKYGTRKDIMLAYPSLHKWEIENGIIDGEEDAEQTYLSEVRKDPTFPTKEEINELNREFENQQKLIKYEQALKLAKENGWERPEKPSMD